MKVSVIIPVHNVERYLARCLDSVLAAADRLAADGHSAEIICVDDGSTDGSAKVLADYSDRVRIISQVNRGQGSARNAALDLFSGDYVLFVDSDDWIPPHAIRRFVEVAEASRAPMVVSMAFARERLAGDPPERPKWKLRSSSWMSGKKVQYSVCNRLIARSLVCKRRFLPVKFEDFAYATEIMCDIGSFAAINEPLYVYCRNGDEASTTRSPFGRSKIRDSFAVVRHVLDYANGRPSFAFAVRQAADGLSSTVNKAYKTGDLALYEDLLMSFRALLSDYPTISRRLSLKARIRLWILRLRMFRRILRR